MDLIDFILSGSLVVVFLSVTLVNRNAWIKVETIALGFFGVLTFVFPKQFLGYMVRKLYKYDSFYINTLHFREINA